MITKFEAKIRKNIFRKSKFSYCLGISLNILKVAPWMIENSIN
jgi:hypothetical protein